MMPRSQQPVVGSVRVQDGRQSRREVVELELENNGTWSTPVSGACIEVVCLSGTVWLTREGDPEDRFLTAGEAFASSLEGRLALMAFSPVRVLVRMAPAREEGGR